MTETCWACRFWNKRSTEAVNVDEGTKRFWISACRRRAPRLIVNQHGVALTRWPGTLNSDWCGEFEEEPARAAGLASSETSG